MTNTVQTGNCAGNDCCITTVDGSVACAVPPTASPSLIVLQDHAHIGQRLRAGMMFSLACITSPCCTPFIIPVALSLLAGTPAALWLGQNLGWVYSGLTLLSVVSFLLAFRWMRTLPPSQPMIVDILIAESNTGEKSHAN